jgi:hypothetical protein
VDSECDSHNRKPVYADVSIFDVSHNHRNLPGNPDPVSGTGPEIPLQVEITDINDLNRVHQIYTFSQIHVFCVLFVNNCL